MSETLRVASAAHQLDALAATVTLGANFRSFYDAHFAFVWRTLRRMGLQHHECEDVAQEVFLVALRRMDDFEGRSSIRTWLHGIARNLVRNHRRKHHRAEIKHNMLELARAGLSTESPTERSDDRDLLVRLIAQLDEAKQDIYLLAHLEELSFAEISAELGVDIGELRNRLHAARRQLARAAQHIIERDTP